MRFRQRCHGLHHFMLACPAGRPCPPAPPRLSAPRHGKHPQGACQDSCCCHCLVNMPWDGGCCSNTRAYQPVKNWLIKGRTLGAASPAPHSVLVRQPAQHPLQGV
eukprot:gene39655-17297_t